VLKVLTTSYHSGMASTTLIVTMKKGKLSVRSTAGHGRQLLPLAFTAIAKAQSGFASEMSCRDKLCQEHVRMLS
jgi:hypothetical protein